MTAFIAAEYWRSIRLGLVVSLLWAGVGFGQDSGNGDFSGKVRLALPKTIYAVPGLEMNIYFDNIVLVANTANYLFDVTCEKGFQYDRRWTYTPAAEDFGDHSIIIEVRDVSNTVVAKAQSSIRVARDSAEPIKHVSLLAIGDSHLQRDYYLQHVLELSKAEKNLQLTLIGSRGAGNKPPTSELRHEGYNGWTAQAFATITGPKARSGYYVPSETGSPFIYENEDGVPEVDFARYCREFNDGESIDFVIIQVGGNDVWRGTDESIDGLIDRVLGYFDVLIKMIYDFDKETKVGVILLDPPSRSQHGFRNYRGSRKQTRWQYRRNQHRMVERLIARYGDQEQSNVFLIPVNVNLDCVHGFPLRSYPSNARMPAKEKRVYDGAHLSPEGYRQYGDTIYSWIRAS